MLRRICETQIRYVRIRVRSNSRIELGSRQNNVVWRNIRPRAKREVDTIYVSRRRRRRKRREGRPCAISYAAEFSRIDSRWYIGA